jgi:hypothetical protein
MNVIEHQHNEWSRKQRKKGKHHGQWDEIRVHRVTCSCGFTTSWNEDVEVSRLPGQLSMEVE